MVFEVLAEGAENARTSKYLCDLLELTARELTAQVERERRSGLPICASYGKNPGYYIAANKKEMQAYCGRLYHRAGEIFKTHRACINTIDTLPEESTV